MATLPFPGVEVYYVLSALFGSLFTLVLVSAVYIRHLHRRVDRPEAEQEEEESPDIGNLGKIGLSWRAEKVLETIIEGPKLQSDLREELGVSGATVSKAVSELDERGLIKRKKKAQTYLVQPDKERIRNETDLSRDALSLEGLSS